MKQIEAMIACVAVTGAVLYGPLSRGISQIETKAAPMVRSAMLKQTVPVPPAVVAMAELPRIPGAPEAPAALPANTHAREMCSMRAHIAKDQARMQRDMARQNAELTHAANEYAREQVRMQMRTVNEQIRSAMRQAKMQRVVFNVPVGE